MKGFMKQIEENQLFRVSVLNFPL